jgi:flagellar hook assembly protein FlgD
LNGSGSPAATPSRLGRVGLVALLVASLVLGIYVYRARTPDLALEVTSFPEEFNERDAVEVEFFVRYDSDEAEVEIVGRDQVVARTLATGIALQAGEPVNCTWDGRDDSGERVEPGRYRLRVTLPEEDREMVFPKRLDVRVGDLAEDDTNGYTLTIGETCETEGSE